MKSIRSILHILLGVTLICSCNEATELAHITPNVSLIKYKDIVKIDSLYTYPGDSLYQNWINQYNKNLEDKTSRSLSPEDEYCEKYRSNRFIWKKLHISRIHFRRK